MSVSREQLDNLRDCGQDDMYYALTEIRKLTRMAEASNRQFERRIESVLKFLDWPKGASAPFFIARFPILIPVIKERGRHIARVARRLI